MAYSETYVTTTRGEKIYYSSDYQYKIKQPLNPKRDKWRDVGILDYEIAYRAGYRTGYDGKNTFLYIFNLGLAAMDETREWGHYWRYGYKRGRNDNLYNYSNYLDFIYYNNIPTP